MPTYKLTYFNVTGLGEPIRFLLHHGGVQDFEDKRIELNDWAEVKSEFPMEVVPTFEIDGKVYHQSRAIGRYLAKKFNVYGADDLEAMQIDASVDDFDDWRKYFTSWYWENDDAAFKEKLKRVALEKNDFFLKKFEERLAKNNGYFVGNKISWADIYFSGIAELVNNYVSEDLIKDYQSLAKLYDEVRALPKIKAYLDKRPKTDL